MCLEGCRHAGPAVLSRAIQQCPGPGLRPWLGAPTPNQALWEALPRHWVCLSGIKVPWKVGECSEVPSLDPQMSGDASPWPPTPYPHNQPPHPNTEPSTTVKETKLGKVGQMYLVADPNPASSFGTAVDFQNNELTQMFPRCVSCAPWS